jgi:hypothetical protein
MKRELSWKWRLPIAVAAMTGAVLISRSMIVHGTELAIPKKHHGIVINLTMHREKGLPPKYVPDDKVRSVPVPMDRPAGIP